MELEVKAKMSRKLQNLENSQGPSTKLFVSGKQLLGQQEESLPGTESWAGSYRHAVCGRHHHPCWSRLFQDTRSIPSMFLYVSQINVLVHQLDPTIVRSLVCLCPV